MTTPGSVVWIVFMFPEDEAVRIDSDGVGLAPTDGDRSRASRSCRTPRGHRATEEHIIGPLIGTVVV
jgi:hypothetical protein